MGVKQTEALKLALETLEWINRVNAMDFEYKRKAREALNAIYYALDEQPAPVAKPHEQQSAERGEPVAWAWKNTKTDGRGVYWENPDKFFDMTKPSDYEWTPLYTSPPASKPWVGLTDEERIEILHADGEATVLSLTEAKLREKNA